MVFRTTPQLGPGLETVINENDVWYDIPGKGSVMSPQLGTRESGSDGHVYILVQASAEIAATPTTGTQVIITEPAFTAATGAGGFYSPINTLVPVNAYFWARQGAL